MALIPGVDFDRVDGDQFIRISFAAGYDAVARAIERIVEFNKTIVSHTECEIPWNISCWSGWASKHLCRSPIAPDNGQVTILSEEAEQPYDHVPLSRITSTAVKATTGCICAMRTSTGNMVST